MTDAALGGQRRLFYYPDRFETGFFATYSLRVVKKLRATVPLNVYNLFNEQTIVRSPSSSNGQTRHFAYQYSPLKTAVTARLNF